MIFKEEGLAPFSFLNKVIDKFYIYSDYLKVVTIKTLVNRLVFNRDVKSF